MHVHMHTRTQTCTRAHMHTCTCTRAHTYMCMCMHTCIHIHVCTRVCVHVHVRAHICTHMYVHMHLHTTHIHTHIHTCALHSRGKHTTKFWRPSRRRTQYWSVCEAPACRRQAHSGAPGAGPWGKGCRGCPERWGKKVGCREEGGLEAEISP